MVVKKMFSLGGPTLKNKLVSYFGPRIEVEKHILTFTLNLANGWRGMSKTRPKGLKKLSQKYVCYEGLKPIKIVVFINVKSKLGKKTEKSLPLSCAFTMAP